MRLRGGSGLTRCQSRDGDSCEAEAIAISWLVCSGVPKALREATAE